MNVNLSNAVRMFYGKSSYEMVYMEAIAKIEERYCNGEKPSLYFAWLTTIEKDE